MEDLISQLKALPARWAELPAKWKIVGASVLGLALLVGGSVAALSSQNAYEYVFTGLSDQDSAAAAEALRTARIPVRVEAGGEAIAVPKEHVYDARLLLAAQGLPRSESTGFELFDKSDIGVSEFTQKVNLRRATEGELERTISSLDAVKSARVHVNLSKKGLFRDQDQGATASVVLHLFAGRRLRHQQVMGVRNLVAAAIPGMDAEKISLVDSEGTPLDSQEDEGKTISEYKAKTERELRERVMAVLLPAVGADSVVAQVTADVDMTRVETTEKTFDADNPALRSEHVRNREKAGVDPRAPRGVVGAAGNTPGTQTNANASASSNEKDADETRNYELSSTVTRKVVAMPRVSRVSVAVLIEEKKDRPRTAEEIAQLTALAKRAAGFDASRGDQIEITSSTFARGAPAPAVAVPAWKSPFVLGGAGAGVLLVVVLGVFFFLRSRRKEDTSEAEAAALLTAGGRVDDLESAMERNLVSADVHDVANDDAEGPEETQRTANDVLLERAKTLAEQDPARAAHLLHAWLESDRKAALLEEKASVG